MFTIWDRPDAPVAERQSLIFRSDLSALAMASGGDGVVSGLAVSQRGAGANMSVDVATGTLRLSGISTTHAGTSNLAVSAADATYPRIDIVYATAATRAVRTGTAKINPEQPLINDATEVLLAQIWVPPAATTIVTNDITDRRVFVLTGSDIDHGELQGLADDDHTQYLLLAGRGGAEQDVVGPVTFSTYINIGSNSTPSNTTAGDLKAIRAVVGDDGVLGNDTILGVSRTLTPTSGAISTLSAINNISTCGAGVAADETRAMTLNVNVRPTADHAGQHEGMYLTVTHDSGAFNITSTFRGIVGFVAESQQNVGATTVALADGAWYIYRAVAGTITTARGMFIRRGVSSDAGAIGTGIGIDVSGSVGVSPTTDIGIRLQGNSSTSGTISAMTGIQIAQVTTGTITTWVGIDIAATTQATTNFGIRNASNSVQTKYARFGAVTAPTNVTDGDVSCIRLLTGTDAAFPSNVQGYFNLPASGSVRIDINSTQKYTLDSSNLTVGVDGSAPQLVLSAQDGTNEGGQMVINGAAANIDWTFDSNAGNLRWFESGNVRMLLAPTTHGLRVAGYLRLGSTSAPSITDAGSLTMSGELTATPSAAQNITAASATITANALIVQLTADNSYTLTSAPTISDGQNGQLLIIINVDTTDVITLQDQGTLASSNLRLNANTIALGPRDSIILVFNSTIGDWVQVGTENVL